MWNKMKTVHFLKHLLAFPLIVAAFGVVVMLLWNWLVPGIFGWAAINFWQALGLLVLSKILFGGFGGRHFFGAHGRWDGNRNAIREKWMKMTPEERKDFVNKHHFGRHGRLFAERCNEMFDERFSEMSGGQNTGNPGE
jgi:hypothetical protein